MTYTVKQATAIITTLDAEATAPKGKAAANTAAAAALAAAKKIATFDGDTVVLEDAPTRATALAAESKITVLAEENPKRKGSQSAKRFALYQKAKTVGDYVEACVAAGQPRRKARLDLRYDAAKGYIAVSA